VQQRAYSQPVAAGLVTAIVGFTSSFAVVLAGMRAVGASEAQASSALLVLCVTMGLAAIGLGLRYRIPISIAWSTPGAALLVSTGALEDGFAAAVGGFAICAALLVATGVVPALRAAVTAIPSSLANALLAGALLTLCLSPVHAVVDDPAAAVPVVLAWALLTRFARKWRCLEPWGPRWWSSRSPTTGRFALEPWPRSWPWSSRISLCQRSPWASGSTS
jgi:benzoate membrane transport protein